MAEQFRKIKESCYILKAISYGIKITDNDNMYLFGGHNYYIICDKCK